MKIAICDDCPNDIIYLEELIATSKFCPANLEFYEFLSGEALLEDFEEFDAVFLDMQMSGGMNGAQTAAQIRKKDSEVLLCFCSSFEMNASQILQVKPFEYLIKHIKKEELVLNIEIILKELEERENRPKVSVALDGKAYVLRLTDVVYISIFNKGSEIWLTREIAEAIWGEDGLPKNLSLKSNIKVDAYYKQLKEYGFIYANKSYIVNMEHIIAREKYSVILKGGYNLAVSRGKKRDFDNGFSRYLGVQYHRERVNRDGWETM